MFGQSEESPFTLDAGCMDDIPQVIEEENRILAEEFTEEEVRKVVF
jgi:hypothetical protein